MLRSKLWPFVQRYIQNTGVNKSAIFFYLDGPCRRCIYSHVSYVIAFSDLTFLDMLIVHKNFKITINKRHRCSLDSWRMSFKKLALILIDSSIVYTWISDIVFREIGHWYIIIPIFFARKVIQINKYNHSRHRLTIFQ